MYSLVEIFIRFCGFVPRIFASNLSEMLFYLILSDGWYLLNKIFYSCSLKNEINIIVIKFFSEKSCLKNSLRLFSNVCKIKIRKKKEEEEKFLNKRNHH